MAAWKKASPLRAKKQKSTSCSKIKKHIVNTEELVYSIKRPDLTIGGIRYKYTLQWFRIDTMQHVPSFFAKVLSYWEK